MASGQPTAPDDLWALPAREFEFACRTYRDSDPAIAAELSRCLHQTVTTRQVLRWRSGDAPVPAEVWRLMLRLVGLEVRLVYQGPSVPSHLHVLPGGHRRRSPPPVERVQPHELRALLDAARRARISTLPGIDLLLDHVLGLIHRALTARETLGVDDIDHVLRASADSARWRADHHLPDPFQEDRALAVGVWSRLRQEALSREPARPAVLAGG